MRVAVIDYGSGNLRSASKALERAAAEAGLAAEVTVTAEPQVVAGADRIVLPGVGAFGACRRGLLARDGMMAVLEHAVIGAGRPFLGICVGMQLMATRSLEHGVHEGFGWIPGEVVAITPKDSGEDVPFKGWNEKVPYMSWNELEVLDDSHPVFRGLGKGAHVYFVHGYQFAVADPAHVLAEADYGGPITAAVGRDNLVGTQFHPEKSQATGLRLLTNFLTWEP